MNLLPSTEKDYLKKGFKLRAIVVASFLVASFFLVGLLILIPSYFLALGNFSKSDREMYSLSKKNEGTIQTVLNVPSEIDSKLKFLQSKTNNISAAESFGSIAGFLPQGVTLNSIQFSRTQSFKGKAGIVISFSGVSLARDSLVSFSNLLKESKQFSEVDVPVSSLTKDRNSPFSINVFIEN